MAPINKHEFMSRVQAQLGEDVAALRAAANLTRAGVIHEESRPENDKDTRAIEASYLARGQARRVEEMEEVQTRLRFLELRDFSVNEPIDLGAAVTLESDSGTQHVLIVPVGGGLAVEMDGVRVQLLTPSSPLGQSLMGKTTGDDVEVRTRGRSVEHVIVAVR